MSVTGEHSLKGCDVAVGGRKVFYRAADRAALAGAPVVALVHGAGASSR
jgi:hypothetical protein